MLSVKDAMHNQLCFSWVIISIVLWLKVNGGGGGVITGGKVMAISLV